MPRTIFGLYIFCYMTLACVTSPLTYQNDYKWIIRELSDTFTDEVGFLYPDSIRISLTCKPIHVVLNLVRNTHIQNSFPLLLGRHGKVFAWKPESLQRFAAYQDKRNSAYILLTFENEDQQQTTTRRVYQGSFYVGNKAYHVDPTHVTSSSGPHTRQRRLAETYSSSMSGSHAKPFGRPDPVKYSSASSAAKQYIVEMFMVVDYATYMHWYKTSSERTAVKKMNDAIKSIHRYYALVANGVDLRYASIDDNRFSINVHLTGLFLATTAADSPFTEASSVKSFYLEEAYCNSTAALIELKRWIQNNNAKLPPYDQVTLFTGNLLRSNQASVKPITLAGLAHVASICTANSVAVCQEWNYFATVETAAHELGHSLGSLHDGQDNACKSTDQYIMATAPGDLDSSNHLNPFNFSQCSIRSFGNFLTNQSSCLLNRSNTLKVKFNHPAGQYVSIDKQCQLLYGINSYYCAGSDNDAIMCETLNCYDVERKLCLTRVEQRAADGTTCGDKKWCHRGSCTYNEKAPSVPGGDFCLSGDSKNHLVGGFNCEISTRVNPGLCYEQSHRNRCCYSCKLWALQGTPDCLYGDRNKKFCDSAELSNCYKEEVRNTCCRMCGRPKPHFGNCLYGDRASWCSTVKSSQCYATDTVNTCCETCGQFALTGHPGCEYGDKADWCLGYTAQKCKEVADANDTCCHTCGSTREPVNTDCQDTAPECSSVIAKYCYEIDKKCCHSCRSFEINLPGCQYGDRYDWCNKTLEPEPLLCNNSIVLNNCCYTCYKLEGVTRKPVKSEGEKPLADGVLVVITLSLLFLYLCKPTWPVTTIRLHSCYY